MASTISLATLIASLVMVMVMVTLTQACKPMHTLPLTVEYKLMKSDIVASGYPRKRLEENAVDFEVRCIFKGGPLKEMITIHNVGIKDSQCRQSNMPIDTALLVYLNRIGNRTVVNFREDPGEEEYLEEVPVICGVTVTYPMGFSDKNNKGTCPEEFLYDDCIDQPTEAPLTEGEVPYEPVKTDGGENANDNTDIKVDNMEDGKTGKVQGEGANDEEEKSGDMTLSDGQGGTTPKNKGQVSKPSLITPLVCLLACLGVFVNKL